MLLTVLLASLPVVPLDLFGVSEREVVPVSACVFVDTSTLVSELAAELAVDGEMSLPVLISEAWLVFGMDEVERSAPVVVAI